MWGLSCSTNRILEPRRTRKKINYQRALQGELMRAINTLTAVKQSKVDSWRCRKRKLFSKRAGSLRRAWCSSFTPAKTLSPDQVRGITFLVSSAVENLDPEKVTVVDSRGKILSKALTAADSAASGELMEIEAKGLKKALKSASNPS